MAENIHPIFDRLVTRAERERFLNQQSATFWMTGLSGSGKSTIAQGVERQLFSEGYFVQVLDGDNIRSGLCSNLGFTAADRTENIRRIAEVSKLYNQSGIITLCSFVSPTREIRAMARELIGADNYYEVYVNTALELCEARDVKGLYQKARNGEIKNFTGISAPYEAPEAPAFEIKTAQQTVAESIAVMCDFVKDKAKLQ